jgi:hypothetical protein
MQSTDLQPTVTKTLHTVLDWLTKAAADPQRRAVMASFILFCSEFDLSNGKCVFLMVNNQLGRTKKNEGRVCHVVRTPLTNSSFRQIG